MICTSSSVIIPIRLMLNWVQFIAEDVSGAHVWVMIESWCWLEYSFVEMRSTGAISRRNQTVFFHEGTEKFAIVCTTLAPFAQPIKGWNMDPELNKGDTGPGGRNKSPARPFPSSSPRRSQSSRSRTRSRPVFSLFPTRIENSRPKFLIAPRNFPAQLTKVTEWAGNLLPLQFGSASVITFISIPLCRSPRYLIAIECWPRRGWPRHRTQSQIYIIRWKKAAPFGYHSRFTAAPRVGAAIGSEVEN